jgi:hypothetical protein
MALPHRTKGQCPKGKTNVMPVIQFNIDRELKKAAQGKKTKVPVGQLLYLATKDYPAVQACIAEAFSITEVRI